MRWFLLYRIGNSRSISMGFRNMRLEILTALWITLCVNWYKAGFCCGMQQSVIFLSFKGCGPQETPYNAPPSTRRMWITSHKQPVRLKRKTWKWGLTLKEESVIYATSRQSAKARRNCSLTIYQTICVGTRRYGFLTSQDEKWIPSLWVNIRNSLRSLIHEHQT